MNVEYRRMLLPDTPAVHGIEERTFAVPWTLRDFEYEAESPCARYLVAVQNGQVIGYAGMRFVMEEGDITNVAVDPDFRGMGVGRGLVSALMQYAANLGVTALTLEVRKSNSVAQHVYQKLGFERYGVRKGYYEDNGEDAWLMVCTEMPKPDPDFAEDRP